VGRIKKMNEHLKELAIQAKIQMVSEPRLQEFAEFIIRECADIVINEGRFTRYDKLSIKIKERFGVTD
jgi:hypothetical protein